MLDLIFKNKKLNSDKLLLFGFVESERGYTYTTTIADKRFQMIVDISKDGEPSAKVVDPLIEEEYLLHRVTGACGSFVGRVKADYEATLFEISEACYESDVFKSDCAGRVMVHVRNTYGDELEFLWKRFPNTAIFRRQDTGKWYGAMIALSKRKLGLDSDDVVDVLNLRIKTKDLDSVVNHEHGFPGYHMNKRHWYTLCLDGFIPFEEICRRISDSHQLAVKR